METLATPGAPNVRTVGGIKHPSADSKDGPFPAFASATNTVRRVDNTKWKARQHSALTQSTMTHGPGDLPDDSIAP